MSKLIRYAFFLFTFLINNIAQACPNSFIALENEQGKKVFLFGDIHAYENPETIAKFDNFLKKIELKKNTNFFIEFTTLREHQEYNVNIIKDQKSYNLLEFFRRQFCKQFLTKSEKALMFYPANYRCSKTIKIIAKYLDDSELNIKITDYLKELNGVKNKIITEFGDDFEQIKEINLLFKTLLEMHSNPLLRNLTVQDFLLKHKQLTQNSEEIKLVDDFYILILRLTLVIYDFFTFMDVLKSDSLITYVCFGSQHIFNLASLLQKKGFVITKQYGKDVSLMLYDYQKDSEGNLISVKMREGTMLGREGNIAIQPLTQEGINEILKYCLSQHPDYQNVTASSSATTVASKAEEEKQIKFLCNACKLDLTGSDLKKKCSSCKLAYYCNVECQRTDWPNHKQICIKK